MESTNIFELQQKRDQVCLVCSNLQRSLFWKALWIQRTLTSEGIDIRRQSFVSDSECRWLEWFIMCKVVVWDNRILSSGDKDCSEDFA